MSAAVDRILAKLPPVKQTGDSWMARCPAHDDQKASLSIADGDDGRALLHCHAGCTTEAIVKALGLGMGDLFPTKPSANGHKPSVKLRIVATYDYRDENGNLLYQTIRYEPKDFRQRRPDGKGGWTWNLNGTRRVLYGLPELLAAPADALIFGCEGEKDKDRLASLGLVATTNVGGAEKWRPEYAEALRGRHVVLLPDNDAAGEKHVAKVAASLVGIATSVKIIRLPNLPPKGDVSDWLDAGGTREDLERLVSEAPEYTVPTASGLTEAPTDDLTPETARDKLTALIDQVPDTVDPTTADAMVENAVPFLRVVGPAARELYSKMLARKLRIPVGPIREALKQADDPAQDATSETMPTPPTAEELYERCKDLAAAPDLLDRVYGTMCGLGLIGEERNAKLLYLAGTARLLDKPVSAIVKGPSSGGKSHLLGVVAKLLPACAYVDYTAVSAKYLAYASEPLKHRIVILYESGGIADGQGAYIMRSLLSEGRLNIGTVEKHGDDNNSAYEASQIVKEGPTALFTSTTRAALDAELQTRALDLTITDTPEHSRAILRGTAAHYTDDAVPEPDLTAFHALQGWLQTEAGSYRVGIPYASLLAAKVPVEAVRIRRDFSKLLSLIAAGAILHQAQRERGQEGQIIASIDDYAIVRELVAESFAAAQQGGITPAQRTTIQAVIDLCAADQCVDAGISRVKIAEHLKIDKSRVTRNLANAIREGYVRDLRPVGPDGKPRRAAIAMYAPGEPLPPEPGALPTIEDILRATNANSTAQPHNQSVSPVLAPEPQASEQRTTDRTPSAQPHNPDTQPDDDSTITCAVVRSAKMTAQPSAQPVSSNGERANVEVVRLCAENVSVGDVVWWLNSKGERVTGKPVTVTAINAADATAELAADGERIEGWYPLVTLQRADDWGEL